MSFNEGKLGVITQSEKATCVINYSGVGEAQSSSQINFIYRINGGNGMQNVASLLNTKTLSSQHIYIYNKVTFSLQIIFSSF
jgi:hypothetical protein